MPEFKFCPFMSTKEDKVACNKEQCAAAYNGWCFATSMASNLGNAVQKIERTNKLLEEPE
jgi:hypothetical protein